MAFSSGERVLYMGNNEKDIWEQILLHQGEVFRTSGRGKKPGIAYTYSIKNRSDGTPGGEMFIHHGNYDTVWQDKAITKSTVLVAHRNAMEEQARTGYVSGPKKLNCFGASYLYPVFLKLGIITGNSQLSVFNSENMMEENVMEENTPVAEQPTEKSAKRLRRSGDQVRADKIKALDEKIAKKESELAALREQREKLMRPPELSDRDKQKLLREKIEAGNLTEDEAYQLGWNG